MQNKLYLKKKKKSLRCGLDSRLCLCVFTFCVFSFFVHFFSTLMNSNIYCSCMWLHWVGDKITIYVLFIHYSCTFHGTHNYFIQKKNIKNETYNTIYTFKNYFVTVFSILRDFMDVNKMSGCNLLLQQVKRV